MEVFSRGPRCGALRPAIFIHPYLLKPVRGVERERIRKFCQLRPQDYPDFEILFAAADGDPAVPVVQRLIAGFPERLIRLVVVTERLGANSKVSNLCRLVRESAHDLMVITDSDVHVETTYLKSVAALFFAIHRGVIALYRGSGNFQFVAALDCVGSSAAFCGAALVARELEDIKFMMGSTMATTKQRLAEIGGFEAMVDLHWTTTSSENALADRGYRHRTALRSGRHGISVAEDRSVLASRIALGHGYRKHPSRWTFRNVIHSRPSLDDCSRLCGTLSSNCCGISGSLFHPAGSPRRRMVVVGPARSSVTEAILAPASP